ncbi:hypothetical protein BWR15_06145 [Pseudomonas sp. T]|nr:hypothetical protein BWR15_06145 [Pseudomonas sp. T]
MRAKYSEPGFQKRSFTCIHCHTLTSMTWARYSLSTGSRLHPSEYFYCGCDNCGGESLWLRGSDLDGTLIYPDLELGQAPHEDMPEDCLPEYAEARDICKRSPRGAAALLRLCLEKLLVHLGGSGKGIDADIKKLVAEGLSEDVQQALDVIRVTGNNAVHPMEMNLEDDHDSVTVLFEMINFIIEERISRPARLRASFDRLPAGALAAIQRRDKQKPQQS